MLHQPECHRAIHAFAMCLAGKTNARHISTSVRPHRQHESSFAGSCTHTHTHTRTHTRTCRHVYMHVLQSHLCERQRETTWHLPAQGHHSASHHRGASLFPGTLLPARTHHTSWSEYHKLPPLAQNACSTKMTDAVTTHTGEVVEDHTRLSELCSVVVYPKPSASIPSWGVYSVKPWR